MVLAYGFDFLAGLRAGADRPWSRSRSSWSLAGATKKYLCSYWWWGWRTRACIRPATRACRNWPASTCDPDEIKIYERIVDIAARRAGPQDTIFTFPSIPLFNVLTGHLQPTLAPVHFLDVCPDAVQRRDAAYLRQNPPRILVWLRARPSDSARLQLAFRGGTSNGYHEMEKHAARPDRRPAPYTLEYRVIYNDQCFRWKCGCGG